MAEFDGPDNDTGLWEWSISEPGEIRFYKYVLGRTIEEIYQYRIENGCIVFTLPEGNEMKLIRSDSPVAALERAVA